MPLIYFSPIERKEPTIPDNRCDAGSKVDAAARTARLLDRSTTVSVVVPCYNEESVLPAMIARLKDAADEWGTEYEVILVDDGSRDDTWSLIESQCEADPRWRGVALGRNFGHQIAVWAGLDHSSGDVVTVLDADLQDPPEVVGEFLQKWAEGYDVIYAIRKKRKENVFRRSAYFLFYRVLAMLADIEIPLDSGDFSVVDRRVVDAMLSSREQQPFIRGLRSWVGFKQIGMPYERAARAAGVEKYTLSKLVDLAASGLVSFSSRPLHVATIFGFLIAALAAAGAVFTFVQRVFAEWFAEIGLRPVPGFATTVIAVLFLGAVQLICIGILGEYIGRIYDNVKGRPQYTVGQTAGFDRKRPE